MDNSFGIIHDLAGIEVQVRRSLQFAAHEISCGISLIEHEYPLDNDNCLKLKEMLERAMRAIREVAGN